MQQSEIIALLRSEGEGLQRLYDEADRVRAENCGDEVYLRGIIEFSNYCRKNCFYCGIRCDNSVLNRYRIGIDEIIDCCKQIEANGQTTVVLQSGEDPYYTRELLGNIIGRIKAETRLAITLSAGERDEETYRYWQQQGMDRYLIRMETFDRELFSRCHPDDDYDTRLECIKTLKRIGVQTGSGILIGLPGQTIEQLADDMAALTELELDMIGVGPFIPNPETPFAEQKNPFDSEVYFKVIAILRLMNPKAHIPATTAFDAIHPMGRELLLQRGANIFMPNATPQQYRKDYQLYPGKPCVDEGANDCAVCVQSRVQRIGRVVGKGPGHSLR